MIPPFKKSVPHEYYDPDTDPFIPDPHADKTVPALLTRLLTQHYTHKSYGRALFDNLAPGLNANAIPDDLPADVRQLLEWHNGYRDNDGDIEILPVYYRLLSLEEALAFSRSININSRDDPQWWNDDIYPVFLKPDLQTCIVVSRSTGRAAYRRYASDLTDERSMGWFPNLYQLLRKVEVAAEEKRIGFAKASGRPVEGPFIGEPEKEVLILTDDEEEDEEEDEDEEDEDEDEEQEHITGSEGK